MMLRLLVALLCVAGVSATPAQESPTLRKIREAGMISIGYRESSVPFSYLDSAQRPVGYSMAICDRIVDAVRQRLGLADLERRLVPVSSATRIPLVTNGTIDLECGVTTNTAERQRQVAFTVTTFVAASRLVSRKSAPVMRLEDLRGKTVTSTVGTTSLAHLQKLHTERGLEMSIVAVREDTDAFRLVETDRAAAYAMDDVLLRGTIAVARHPEDFVVSDEALSVEPYGIMLGKGDPQFKQLADQAIKALFKSGEIHRLYRQWFESPIPPNGVNLGLPMHPAMRRVIEQPTDSPDPAAYR
ncbi:MAG: amino acid ABC transporter substrate-binding protein [Betaproteobacteria bacterium]|nr:MAG: amino acid ABC transporter substrate-binding protein [Betaproteobacteria bacterium]